MGELIEDVYGAPYPHCKHCGDQVAPNGDPHPDHQWSHIYSRIGFDGEPLYSYLHRCQHTVPYGQNAEPDDE